MLGAHLAALAIAVAPRRIRPLAGLNLAVAGFILVGLAGRLRYPPVDHHNVELAVFELAAAVAAALAFARVRAAAYATGAVFAVHVLASGAAVGFALLFRLTRLI